jgi:hypothetical protein
MMAECLDRAFAMCRNKNRGWDSKRRGLHDTLLQRATWRSIRDTYFAAPPTGLFPSAGSHGASVAPAGTVLPLQRPAFKAAAAALAPAPAALAPAPAPAAPIPAPAPQVVVYAPIRNLFAPSSLFYAPVPRSVAPAWVLPPPQAEPVAAADENFAWVDCLLDDDTKSGSASAVIPLAHAEDDVFVPESAASPDCSNGFVFPSGASCDFLGSLSGDKSAEPAPHTDPLTAMLYGRVPAALVPAEDPAPPQPAARTAINRKRKCTSSFPKLGKRLFCDRFTATLTLACY